jgi:hypothetical protein
MLFFRYYWCPPLLLARLWSYIACILIFYCAKNSCSIANFPLYIVEARDMVVNVDEEYYVVIIGEQ